MSKVLLTGGSGQLGRCLLDRLPAEWQVFAPRHDELDIANEQAVQAYVGAHVPDIIINAAAFNAVDQAEHNPVRADAVNALGPANLATAAAQARARLVHISTDYVFDGRTAQPYTELDAPLPINQYGLSKMQGEQNVLSTLPDAIVIRTSWLFSEYGHNFVRSILQQATTGTQSGPGVDLRAGSPSGSNAPALRVVDDQTGCPTYAGDLAQAVISLALRHNAGQNPDAPSAQMPDANAPDTDRIYHYCGSQAMTWHAFAQQILACASSQDKSLRIPRLYAIKSSAYAAPAARPAMSVLSCEKIKAMGIACLPLEHSLAKVVGLLLAESAGKPIGRDAAL